MDDPADITEGPAQPTDDDRLYRWTIRSLYIVAIGLNVWLLWDQMKDGPEAQMAKAQLVRWKDQALKPMRDRQMFRKHANRLLYEATEIVEAAQ